jgi:hypothetical protein
MSTWISMGSVACSAAAPAAGRKKLRVGRRRLRVGRKALGIASVAVLYRRRVKCMRDPPGI